MVPFCQTRPAIAPENVAAAPTWTLTESGVAVFDRPGGYKRDDLLLCARIMRDFRLGQTRRG